MEKKGGTYRCASFSPNGRMLALGSEEATISLWEMPEVRERKVLRGHSKRVRSLAFSPDGHFLVSTGDEGRAVLWDAVRGVELRTLHAAGGDPVRSAVFSPDGRSVALGELAFTPREILLVDVNTGAVRSRLPGHRFGINQLAFSPDGRLLASAGVDRCIKVWDLATGRTLKTLKDDVGYVKSVAFSRDGSWLAFAGNDEKVGRWALDLPPARSLGPRSMPAIAGNGAVAGSKPSRS
jgi:WD40 repeat protein